MMGRADRYFVQQQLKEMNLKEPAFAQRPTLLGAQPDSPEREQYDSAREDAEEEDGEATSVLDAEFNASTGEEMELSGVAEETAPCAENAHGREGNFSSPKTDASVFPYSGKPPRRMLSHTGTGAARSRTP